MKWGKLLLILFFASILFVNGCSNDYSGSSATGQIAPGFSLYDTSGNRVSLADFKGRPVLLNFWAIRCPPCRAEMPYIQQAYDEWSTKGLVILEVNNGETVDQVKEYANANRLSLTFLMDTTGDVASNYGVYYIPATFMIDKNGMIKHVAAAPFESRADVDKYIKKIMN